MKKGGAKLIFCLTLRNISVTSPTAVGDFINILKTTFDFNFDLFQAFKQHGYTKTWKQRKVVDEKSFSLIKNQSLIKRSSSLFDIITYYNRIISNPIYSLTKIEFFSWYRIKAWNLYFYVFKCRLQLVPPLFIWWNFLRFVLLFGNSLRPKYNLINR